MSTSPTDVNGDSAGTANTPDFSNFNLTAAQGDDGMTQVVTCFLQASSNDYTGGLGMVFAPATKSYILLLTSVNHRCSRLCSLRHHDCVDLRHLLPGTRDESTTAEDPNIRLLVRQVCSIMARYTSPSGHLTCDPGILAPESSSPPGLFSMSCLAQSLLLPNTTNNHLPQSPRPRL